MGLLTADGVAINPTAETVIAAGDQIIVIAEDDSAVALSAPGSANESLIVAGSVPVGSPERTLVLGYNSALHVMLSELAEYVPAKSSVTVVSDVEVPELAAYANMAITVQQADSTSRAVLDALDVRAYDHIIVLAYRENLELQQADAKTLFTLLQLRDIESDLGIDLNIVSEMLDDRNRELAEVTKADDFIVSDKLISLMLSQLSENRQLTDVFTTLFSSEGSEIYLRPAELYVTPGEALDFYTLLESAARKGETAIGYRVAALARSADAAYGVHINPQKAETFRFAPGDKVIVLAED